VLALIDQRASVRAAIWGGDSSQSGPSPCRTYSSASKETSIFKGVVSPLLLTSTRDQACSYDKVANEFTCRERYEDSRGTKYSTTATTKFASIGDFVGDAPRITWHATMEFRPQSGTTRTTGSTAMVVDTIYVYDTQGRLSRSEMKGSTNGMPSSVAETFSAWDAYGRPTSSTNAAGSLTYAYDDGARTMTQTLRGAASVWTTVTTLDANGVVIGRTSSGTGPGASSTSTTIKVESIAQVCR